jgi:hypothetical protein
MAFTGFFTPALPLTVTYVLNLLCYLCPEPAPWWLVSHRWLSKEKSGLQSWRPGSHFNLRETCGALSLAASHQPLIFGTILSQPFRCVLVSHQGVNPFPTQGAKNRCEFAFPASDSNCRSNPA